MIGNMFKLIAMLVLGALAIIVGIAGSALTLVVTATTAVLGFFALIGVTIYAVIADFVAYKRDK